jgi:hypothetical protein
MSNQTDPVDKKTIQVGSAKVMAGPDINSQINLGVGNKVVVKLNINRKAIMADNSGTPVRETVQEECEVTMDMMEKRLDLFAVLYNNLVDYDTVPASPVTVTNEAVTVNGLESSRLTHKMGDGSIVTSVVVTDVTNVTTYVLDTDYALATDLEGYTTIVRLAGGDISDGDVLHVDYHYTPSASRVLGFGGGDGPDPVVLSLINTNSEGKEFRINVFKAVIDEGFTNEFLKDSDEEVNVWPIKFIGYRDTTRPVKHQILEIITGQFTT